MGVQGGEVCDVWAGVLILLLDELILNYLALWRNKVE